MKNILVCVPFTVPWAIRHHFGKAKTILDVGCGDGSLMQSVNYDKKYKVVGVDLYGPSLKRAKKGAAYTKLLLCDIRKLHFKDESFDVVLSHQVVEHFNKKEALKIISKMEKISRNKIIISTTNGFVPFIPLDVSDHNPLQIHKSGWAIEEMKTMGYRVFGHAARFIYHTETGLLYRFRNFKHIFIMIAFILAPIIYYFPKPGTYIVAVRKKDGTR